MTAKILVLSDYRKAKPGTPKLPSFEEFWRLCFDPLDLLGTQEKPKK